VFPVWGVSLALSHPVRKIKLVSFNQESPEGPSLADHGQFYKTNFRVKLLAEMGFFAQKSKISKLHRYKKFILKMRVK
jgi:hypothetical protein